MTKHILTLFALTAALTACEEEESSRAPFVDDAAAARSIETQPAEGWDAAPPADLERGDLAILRMASPFFDRVQEQVFEYHGDGIWKRADNSRSALRDAFRPCVTNTENAELHWNDNSYGPTMELYGAGLQKTFRPARHVDHWRGQVRPNTQPNPRCRHAMKRAGLTWPVAARVQVVEILD